MRERRELENESLRNYWYTMPWHRNVSQKKEIDRLTNHEAPKYDQNSKFRRKLVNIKSTQNSQKKVNRKNKNLRIQCSVSSDTRTNDKCHTVKTFSNNHSQQMIIQPLFPSIILLEWITTASKSSTRCSLTHIGIGCLLLIWIYIDIPLSHIWVIHIDIPLRLRTHIRINIPLRLHIGIDIASTHLLCSKSILLRCL